MKKIICLTLACVMLLSLCACGGKAATPTTNAPATEPGPTKPAPTVQVVEGEPIQQLDDVSVYIRKGFTFTKTISIRKS